MGRLQLQRLPTRIGRFAPIPDLGARFRQHLAVLPHPGIDPNQSLREVVRFGRSTALHRQNTGEKERRFPLGVDGQGGRARGLSVGGSADQHRAVAFASHAATSRASSVVAASNSGRASSANGRPLGPLVFFRAASTSASPRQRSCSASEICGKSGGNATSGIWPGRGQSPDSAVLLVRVAPPWNRMICDRCVHDAALPLRHMARDATITRGLPSRRRQRASFSV